MSDLKINGHTLSSLQKNIKNYVKIFFFGILTLLCPICFFFFSIFSGDWIAFGCSELGQLLVWEWQSETYVLKQQGHFNNMASVSFSPDATVMATGGQDGKVSVKSILEKTPGKIIQNPLNELMILTIFFSRRGCFIVK